HRRQTPEDSRHHGTVDDRIDHRAAAVDGHDHVPGQMARSEEHTSELQSLTNLVCRLLLEKKKNQTAAAESTIKQHPGATAVRYVPYTRPSPAQERSDAARTAESSDTIVHLRRNHDERPLP